jgi:diketogulonate reductase-like aldo/keto reductase
MFDSAQMYGNEREVGSAIMAFLRKNPSLKREDIYYTTKLAINSGYSRSLKAIEQSLQRCGLGYIDLILIHSPYGGSQARKESWEALLEAQKKGWTKSVGVSNYGVRHLQEMLRQGQRPTVNQVDLHPFMTRTDIVEFCKKNDIVLEVIILRLMANPGIRAAHKRVPDQTSTVARDSAQVQSDCSTDLNQMGATAWIR